MAKKIEKTEVEWRKQLKPEQYRICRQKGTEPAFTGEYWNCNKPGNYHCVACDAKLFAADDKFNAGCGWPSFTQPTNKNAIAEQADFSHNMQRTEVLCQQCGSHLGHVFPDGPEPTGLRYCINSVALKLKV